MSVKTVNKMKSSPTMRSCEDGGKDVFCDIDGFRGALLTWYDRHRRTLPWRAEAPNTANPYHVWLSEIMLQQTVVAAVIPYFLKFVEKWPEVGNLADADQNEVMQAWAGLGYYARARNLHKCAQIVAGELGGVFPDSQQELKKLPGIGDYTSAAIAAIAFGQPATVVDGNVERVISRYFAITEPLPDSKPLIKQHTALLSEDRTDRPGDFAQAMMDLGATLCSPKSPNCMLCPLREGCEGHRAGLAQELPRKKPKIRRPHKYGHIYWLQNERGDILVERRPEQGLLGGMLGLPTSLWLDDEGSLEHLPWLGQADLSTKPDWQVSHVFTHFSLRLKGHQGNLSGWPADNENLLWLPVSQVADCGLPTVFKKFARLMLLKP